MQRAWIARDMWAVERIRQYLPHKRGDLVRADFLHVVAQENGFASWPVLKAEATRQGFDRAEAQQRLKIALVHGQTGIVAQLLEGRPDLADGLFGLECALYRRAAVESALARDTSLAVKPFGPRTAFQHLAFSKWITMRPELAEDMLGVADALHAAGADISAPLDTPGGRVTPLFGAVSAGNVALLRWLLDHGAAPEGDALYHATELADGTALDLLLQAGARIAGTNAVHRAMDFDDAAKVAALLAAPDASEELASAEIPVLHHAARRGCSAQIVDLLLQAGADPDRPWQGVSAYAYARVHGAGALVDRLNPTPLTPQETLLAQAAEGQAIPGQYLDPNALPAPYANLVHEVLTRPGGLAHVRALVALGLPWDAPDAQGVTPVQLGGYHGLADVVEGLLALRPDLSHVNGYGGTLLTTILHGAETCPTRDRGDYRTCLQLVLDAGVALPRRAIRSTGRADLRDFLSDWAEARPGQVV